MLNDRIMVLECMKSERIWFVNRYFYDIKYDIFETQHSPTPAGLHALVQTKFFIFFIWELVLMDQQHRLTKIEDK